MKKKAKLSRCRNHRFALWRIWGENRPAVMFICLNPSIADEAEDDPTLVRCINFAKSWGFGGVCIGNLFSLRATDPKVMLADELPVHRQNDKWLKKMAAEADMVIASWGNLGGHRGRSKAIRNMIPDLHYLRLNASGEPAHPLYLKADLKPTRINGH